MLLQRFWRNRLSVVGVAILLAWIVVALLAPTIAPYDPVEVHLKLRMQAPGAAHWLGTDFYGCDILSRILYGAR